MASRVAAQDLVKFCDQNPDCGIWYHIAETTSQFTFANSESTTCNHKLVVCMYDREYVVQSTEFDIVEQSHVPILMSLPQMHNLRFQFELHPDKALLSSPVLGIWDVKLKVAPGSHLVLDLLDLSRLMWNVRFDKHKKSSFLTYFTHYEYGFHQKSQGSSSQEEVPEKLAFATDDEWAIDEANMELTRVHKHDQGWIYASWNSKCPRTPPSTPAQPSPREPSPGRRPAQPSPAQPSPAQPKPSQPSPAQPSPPHSPARTAKQFPTIKKLDPSKDVSYILSNHGNVSVTT